MSIEAPPPAHVHQANDLSRSRTVSVRTRQESSVLKSLSHTSPDPLLLANSIVPPRELDQLKNSSKTLHKFYKNQNEHIDSMLSDPEQPKDQQKIDLLNKHIKIALYSSVLGNLLLFALQLYAALVSKSYSLYATMADAMMDLVSSIVILAAQWYSSRESLLKFPAGKKRMEIVGVIIFAVLMAVVSLQLIFGSVRNLIDKISELDLSVLALVCVGVGVAVKIVLYWYCKRLSEDPTARILALDHFNDIILCIAGLIFSVMGAKVAWWIDPVGGLFIGLLMLRSWTVAAYEHVELIVGKTADNYFLQKLTYLVLMHDDRIVQVNSVKAYHLGNHMYAEVDLMLPGDMPLHTAQGIVSSLESKIQSLDNIEKAYVRLEFSK